MAPNADDYTQFVAGDRQAENRVLMHLDAAGYAVRCGGWHGMVFLGADDAPAEFLKFMRDGLTADPLPREDLVMPPLWPVDENGRGLSVLEVERQQHLTTHTKEKAA